MKYDVERLEADLLTLVQSNLPTKIAEITAEKNDGITIDVPSDSEYFNTTDDAVNNNKISLQYGVVDGNPLSIGPNTAEDNRYIFIVYLDEKNLKPGIARKKLHRYIRALKEIFEENFRSFNCASILKIQTIAPQSWAENEISPTYKVGGVFIETSIV